MKIPDEKIPALDAIVRARAPLLFRACPGCGQLNWHYGDRIWYLADYTGMHPRPQDPDAPPGTSLVYPLIVLMCGTCSYTHLIAAKSIGAIKGDGELNLG